MLSLWRFWHFGIFEGICGRSDRSSAARAFRIGKIPQLPRSGWPCNCSAMQRHEKSFGLVEGFSIHGASDASISIQQSRKQTHRCACSGTGLFSLPFSKAALTLPMHHSSIAVCVSIVHVPMCGSNITCGFLTKPGWILGSSS